MTFMRLHHVVYQEKVYFRSQKLLLLIKHLEISK